MMVQETRLLTQGNATRLVLLLEEHTKLDLPARYKQELVNTLKEVPVLAPTAFAYCLPRNSVTFKDAEEETTIHLYVRRLLNNRAESHAIPSDGERMGYAYQARVRGGTSTQIYLQSILKNPELIRMMEEACEDNSDNLVSLLGRIARDTQITQMMKVRMRRPTLVIPGWHEATKVKDWERYGPETKYFKIVCKVPIREITREEYDAIIKAKDTRKKK